MISFSFIIPVYNSELYLKRCLNSLLNQDLDNIEIIAINDGSTDLSLEILNTYKTKYPNIFTVISQENKGIGPARNVGLNVATGEYIWFIDNDDCICPNCLQKLYNVLQKTDCDILDIGFMKTIHYVKMKINFFQKELRKNTLFSLNMIILGQKSINVIIW